IKQARIMCLWHVCVITLDAVRMLFVFVVAGSWLVSQIQTTERGFSEQSSRKKLLMTIWTLLSLQT
ncbi:hypothetical protein, partial [Escherichia coli]|uniref:hypothetical protein n=1 Tax=Escherichia coli TaxID=562 RepID=UPI001AD8CF96